MFQIKDFRSISASMVNVMRSVGDKLTDFRIGSVSRTLVEATAAEIDELYINMLVGLREAIPVSVFNTFGFSARPAEAASTVLRFSTDGAGTLATVAVLIPAGTSVRAPGGSVTYATTRAASIGVGQSYVQVLAAATTPGALGNADAGSITEAVSPIAGVGAIVNPGPVINGRDAETDDERRVRFQGYVSSLARGTKGAVEYGSRSASLVDASGVITEYVAYSLVTEPWVADPAQPISLVLCYIHNGASATSIELVEQTQRVVDGYIDTSGVAVPGWKAAGVKCVVLAATDVVVNIVGTLYLAPGYDSAAVIASASNALRAYIQTRGVGAPVLLSEIIAIVKRDVAGVYNYVPTTPSADVAVAVTQKATPGAVTLVAA